MNIKILGTGCPNCQKLEANTKQVLEELKMEVQMEKVTEIQDIMSYGIMSLPAIIVDGEILSYGVVPDAEEIKNLLTKKLDSISENDDKKCSCSCNGNC